MTRLLAAGFIAALALACVASASPSLAIKKAGVWYWSNDLAKSAIQPADSETVLTPGVGGDVAEGLPLTPAQQAWLRQTLPGTEVVEAGHAPSPGLLRSTGLVVGTVACAGLQPSVYDAPAKSSVYHRFRCTVNGATFKRLAAFTAPVAAARAQIAASAQPVPQALLDSLIAAYRSLGHYQHFGDHVRRIVILTAAGRRTATIK